MKTPRFPNTPSPAARLSPARFAAPIAAALILLPSIGCVTAEYQSPRFVQTARTHRTVAVLPFAVESNGKIPKDLTFEQVASFEDSESLAFQTKFHAALVKRSENPEHRFAVELQEVESTNRLLRERSIGVRESWRMKPEELAEILGVDAVVRTRVRKTRLLSKGAALGIDLGIAALDALTDDDYVVVPRARTHDVSVQSSLHDGRDGAVLWQILVDREASWNAPPDRVIAGIARTLARKFPYQT